MASTATSGTSDSSSSGGDRVSKVGKYRKGKDTHPVSGDIMTWKCLPSRAVVLLNSHSQNKGSVSFLFLTLILLYFLSPESAVCLLHQLHIFKCTSYYWEGSGSVVECLT